MLADLSVQHEKIKEITEEVNTDLTEMSKHKTFKSQAYVTMDDVNYESLTKDDFSRWFTKVNMHYTIKV